MGVYNHSMDLSVDDTRRGDPKPAGRRSAARVLMDENADTGNWIRTEVGTSELDEVRKRLYTLANKAGYGLRTECVPLKEENGDGDGDKTLLRFQVRSKNRRVEP